LTTSLPVLPGTPSWFTRAVLAPHREGIVDVQGCPIYYLEWGAATSPGLVFVHGGAAHAHWWSFLAPLLAGQWRAIALDLSGHGDSGRRVSYSHETWVAEIMAVIGHARLPGPPVLVGHSLGGLVTIQAAAEHSDLLAAAVIVDAPVPRPDPESEAAARGGAFRSPGTYPTLEDALSHFQLVPPQPVEHPFIVEHVARHSLRSTAGGWTCKFDPEVFRHTLVSMRDQLVSVRCRLALIRGEHSAVVPADTAAYMSKLMGADAPMVTIPGAYHHLTLDRPLAFVSALDSLLASWALPADAS
jgi:pimeloyl-ACP methyl ester carboxylesterase